MKVVESKVRNSQCPTEIDMEIHVGPELLASGKWVAAIEPELRDLADRTVEKFAGTGRVNKKMMVSGTCLVHKLESVQMLACQQLDMAVRVGVV